LSGPRRVLDGYDGIIKAMRGKIKSKVAPCQIIIIIIIIRNAEV
jgi:hypothetical protein